MQKILLIEDEISVVNFIKKGLEEESYSIVVALTGEEGEKLAREQVFQLIILDIMLPGKSGLEVCQNIRSFNTKTPILFLTALGTSENVALGLNTGADDYLIKPFKFIELSARIKALLRRSSGELISETTDHILEISDLTIDDRAKQVFRNAKPITLTATEYRLLLTLAKNKGKVMSRSELLESAWDIHFNLGTNVVDVYINYLRKKIDSESEIKLIHTVVGMGYVLKT
ncbi:MAG TPA: response regulator transcription factor [Flavobacteriales bacterium]|nr:response regulator transcription factor [Flavobacteriales bacterium]HRE95744.1 response regulator transcription factor [Flavobacteriales bacterium]HRJ38244.1 response regulator transcription factor [Flavobacteriales bacterium]